LRGKAGKNTDFYFAKKDRFFRRTFCDFVYLPGPSLRIDIAAREDYKNGMGCLVLIGLAAVQAFAGQPPPPPPLGARVWPQPQQQTIQGAWLAVDPTNFSFGTASQTPSAVLLAGLQRYRAICFPPGRRGGASGHSRGLPRLDTLVVSVASRNESLALGASERYDLAIGLRGGGGDGAAVGVATLRADTVWGALRGLETFSQLLGQVISM
jgi:hypothetical protein